MISIDEISPFRIAGGCVLWKEKEWGRSLMEQKHPEKQARIEHSVINPRYSSEIRNLLP